MHGNGRDQYGGSKGQNAAPVSPQDAAHIGQRQLRGVVSEHYSEEEIGGELVGTPGLRSAAVSAV